jgi:hypothetical protein
MFPLRYPPTLQPRADLRRTAARVSPEARAPAEALLYAHSRRRLLSTALRLLLADAASRVCTLANRLLPLPRGALGYAATASPLPHGRLREAVRETQGRARNPTQLVLIARR